MADDAQPAVAGAPAAKRWVGITLFAAALAVVALALWLWSGPRGPAGTSSNGSGGVKSSLHLETFVVNLADREQRSYLRVGIDLGLGRELGKDEKTPLAEVRDTILGVLAQCRAEELLTAAGKAKLKQDLLRALQERVPGLEVEDVYFSEFLIQR